MTNISFDEFINEQTKLATEDSIDKDKELAQWLDSVRDFYNKIEHFLERYIKDDKIKLKYEKQVLHEDFSGDYKIDALTLFIGSSQIHFKPIGTMLVGAKGRIDMTGPRGVVRFVLVRKDASAPRISVRVVVNGQEPAAALPTEQVAEWTWKISTPPPRVKYTELEEESFYTAMMEVAHG